MIKTIHIGKYCVISYIRFQFGFGFIGWWDSEQKRLMVDINIGPIEIAIS